MTEDQAGRAISAHSVSEASGLVLKSAVIQAPLSSGRHEDRKRRELGLSLPPSGIDVLPLT